MRSSGLDGAQRAEMKPRSFFRHLHKAAADYRDTRIRREKRESGRERKRGAISMVVGATGRGRPVGLAHWSEHPEEARPPERGTLCSLAVDGHTYTRYGSALARAYVHARACRTRGERSGARRGRGGRRGARTERELRTTSRNRP